MRDAATEKFAALLRELKQRSGRSYGSLAARLHVSTSTLHRYCNGDAVPASYAPAERFARLCGATPEELVELHRRWHRAHGTRRGATPSWAAREEPGGGGRGTGPSKRGTPPEGAGRGAGPGRSGAGSAGVTAGGQAAGRDGARGRGAKTGTHGDPPAPGAGAPAARGGSPAGDGRPSRSHGAPAGGSGAAAASPVARSSSVASSSSGGSGARGTGDASKSAAQPPTAGGAADTASAPAGFAARDDGAGGGTGPGGAGGRDGTSAPGDAPAPSGAALPGGPRAAAGTRGHRWSRVFQAVRGAAGPDRSPSAGRARLRLVGLPVAGVAAVTVLVAFVATSSGSAGEGRAGGGHGRESGVVADGSRGGGGASGGETVEKGESAGPSERRKPSPAGGGGDGAREDGASATPRKGVPALGEGDGAPAGNPLAWSVRSHVWESGCDHRYLVDKSPDDVPPPPVAQDAEAWASSQGAVHGGTTNIEAAIEPRGDEPVTVTAVHVRKTSTGAPLPWAAFAMSSGCGGEVTEAAYSVDLDMPRPVLKPQQGGDSTQKWDPPALPYRVTPDDPLSLLVHARTEGHDVRWYLEVEWSTGDDSGVIRIDDRGAPFRTSAVKGRPLYDYDTLNGAWFTWPDEDPSGESASPAP